MAAQVLRQRALNRAMLSHAERFRVISAEATRRLYTINGQVRATGKLKILMKVLRTV